MSELHDHTLAPPLEAYHRPSGISEAEVIRAYRRVSEARPCACGSVVTADPNDPAFGLAEHQAQWQHAEWRERHEL